MPAVGTFPQRAFADVGSSSNLSAEDMHLPIDSDGDELLSGSEPADENLVRADLLGLVQSLRVPLESSIFELLVLNTCILRTQQLKLASMLHKDELQPEEYVVRLRELLRLNMEENAKILGREIYAELFGSHDPASMIDQTTPPWANSGYVGRMRAAGKMRPRSHDLGVALLLLALIVVALWGAWKVVSNV